MSSSQQVLHTSWGAIVLEAEDGALTACVLPDRSHQPEAPLASFHLRETPPANATDPTEKVLADGLRYASALLRGEPPGSVPKLREPAGTPFQRAVWQALRQLPYGTVCTYRELAQKIGRPLAARAVGAACGANPLPLFIPCHRVVAAHGHLGGYSGGTAWKKRLLHAEGHAFS